MKGRIAKVLLYLLEREYPVPLKKAAEDTGNNLNTLRKDIKNFREILINEGLTLIAKPNFGIKIEGDKSAREKLKEEIKQSKGKFSDKASKIWRITIAFLLREKIPTIEEFSDLFDISRPTTVKYIKEAKKWLLGRGIVVVGKPGSGYRIDEGSEENIRDAVIASVKNLLGADYRTLALEFSKGKFVFNIDGVMDSKNLGIVKSFLDKVQAETKKEVIEEDLFDIAITIVVSIKRIRKGHLIEFDKSKVREILQNPLSKVVEENIIAIEERFKIKFDDDEIAYLVSKFLGAKDQSMEEVSAPIVSSKFVKIAEEIVQLVDELLSIPLNKQDELVLMLARHLESAIEKVKLGIKIENPASGDLKKDYPEAYAVAVRAKKLIEDKLHIKVPTEEVDYISMYIAAFIEKIKQPVKRKVLVVCPMGIVTSKLLCYKLTNEIPEIEIVQVGSIKDLDNNDLMQKIDLVISTVPLSGLKIPFVTVSPLLKPEDQKLIKETLKWGKGLQSVISKDVSVANNILIFPRVDTKSIKDVIELLGNALVNSGFARKGFVEEVLLREKKYPTGISTEIPIAIPHAGPEFTIKKGIAVATLKYPVKFREIGDPKKLLDVRIVLMPVLTGNEEDGKEFCEILEKLKNRKLAEEILECTSKEDVLRLTFKWFSKFH